MLPYWDDATYLLETLVMISKKFDKDGMDLYVTVPPARTETLFTPVLKGEKKVSLFRDAMTWRRPTKIKETKTDIIKPIQSIFNNFFKDLETRKPPKAKVKRFPKGSDKTTDKTKALTLIIFTNGVWAAMEDQDAINEYVEKLLNDLKRRQILKSTSDRSVSIEFVQFGDDPIVTERLRALDDGMEFKGYP